MLASTTMNALVVGRCFGQRRVIAAYSARTDRLHVRLFNCSVRAVVAKHYCACKRKKAGLVQPASNYEAAVRLEDLGRRAHAAACGRTSHRTYVAEMILCLRLQGRCAPRDYSKAVTRTIFAYATRVSVMPRVFCYKLLDCETLGFKRCMRTPASHFAPRAKRCSVDRLLQQAFTFLS